MNGKQVKKIRKVVNKQVKTNAREVLEAIKDEKFFRRIGIAFRIIFKFRLGEKLGAAQ